MDDDDDDDDDDDEEEEDEDEATLEEASASFLRLLPLLSLFDWSTPIGPAAALLQPDCEAPCTGSKTQRRYV